MRRQLIIVWLLTAMVIMAVTTPSRAETLSERVTGVFAELLVAKLQGNFSGESPFSPRNVEETQKAIGALGGLITSNASTFPLSSTSAGLTFDLSSGVPVAARTSTGPIFAERATTLGKGRLNLGANFSQRNLGRIRGLETDEVVFVAPHKIGSDSLLGGPNQDEWDTIELSFNLDLDATVAAFYGTYGLTDRLDVGLAIPVLDLTLQAEPSARINSASYEDGTASFWYDGNSSSPTLTTQGTPISESIVGIGDIALRAKYHLTTHRLGDLAGLFEARLPTGDEENFLGTGDPSFKFMLLASRTGEMVSPHINVGFDWRTSDVDRNDVEIVIGYDQKISEKLTMALDWQAEFEVGGELEEASFPEPARIGRISGGEFRLAEEVILTNIPNFDKDNIINTSFGVKYAASPKVLFMGNVILPNNSGGIRSDFVWTFGVEANL